MRTQPRTPATPGTPPQAVDPTAPFPESGGDGPGPLTVILKWVARASVAGAVLSLALHLVVGVLASILTIRYPGADAGGAIEGAEVDFAVMTESELAAVLAPSGEDSTPVVPESQTGVDPAAVELSEASTPASPSLSESSVEVEVDAGAGDVSQSDGDGLDTGAGGGGASFFGLEAQGSRFAYIVDRSASMRGPKMARTRSELTRSINGLTENGEFLVVFYSDLAEALGGRTRWRDASERSKADARRLVEEVEPAGGTKPMPAFELVFANRIKPDAVYFMTDGQFPEDVPDRIGQMNQRYRIPVHCILFGEPSPSSVLTDEVRAMMVRIAEQSGGQFRHVEIAP